MNANEPGFNTAAAFIRASERFRRPHLGKAALEGVTRDRSRGFTVAISREVGAQGTAVARELGRRLAWPVYDHELLEQIADELRVGIRQVEYADERPGHWLEESVESLGSHRPLTETTYFIHLRNAVWSLAARGNCVIVGRGAAHLLPLSTTLRLRVQAPLEERVAAVSREQGLSHADAARFVETETHRRNRFIADHCRRDPVDPQNYDLIVDSSRLSVAGCADLSLRALRCLQERAAELESVHPVQGEVSGTAAVTAEN